MLIPGFPPGASRLVTTLFLLALMLGLTACPRPLVPPAGIPGADGIGGLASDQVKGRISFGFIKTQAGIKEDVAPGATVSLIEVVSGHTRTTTRTDADGNFILKYSNGFTPKNGELYYFEAAKGLAGGTGNPNAVGADVVRVRTIASYKNGGWVTLTSGAVTNSILISPMTTALSVVVSLRQTTPKRIEASTLFGAIKAGQPSGGYPDTLMLPNPWLVSEVMVRRAYDLVVDSLSKDRDPVRWIRLSTADPQYNTLLLPDVPFTIAYLSPDAQVALENIQLVGTNFSPYPADNKVYFQTDGGSTVPATVVEVSRDLARLTVKVPATAVNGNIQLEIDGKVLLGPAFRLATRDGHSVVDAAGNVYAVNKTLGTVAIIEPILGTDKTGVRALISGLSSPGALTFGVSGYNHLYVATGGGTAEVRKYDITASPLTYTAYHAGAGVPNPSGIAFQAATGALYLTDAVLNRLYVIASEGGTVQQVALTGAALAQPRGLSFGPDGKLYLANSGGNNVLVIDLSSATTGTATEYIGGLSTPWGLAFDNKGSFYVSNNAGNSVYTVPVTSPPGETPLTYGSLTSFASIPTPGGIDADSSGYLYVADNVSNGIYRINTLAESRQIGFGLSYPVAVWADAEGIFTLTDEGRILKIDNQEKLSVYAEGLTNARGLVRDSNGNFYVNQRGLFALTQVRPDGSSVQILQGLNSYTSSNLSIHNNRIILRKTSSDVSGHGQVDVFDLANLAPEPNATHRAAMRRVIAIAQDESGGAHHGKFYAVQDTANNEQTVLRVTRLTRERSDTERFLGEADRLKLIAPTDIAVASDGRIWVSDSVGSDGNGSLVIYTPNGTVAQEITTIENPVRLRRIGTQIVASSDQASGYVRFYNADGTEAKTFTGLNRPVGVTFAGTDMYVNTHGDGQVYKITNYAGRASGSLAPLPASYFASGNVNDIEMMGTDLMVTRDNRIWQLKDDQVTLNTSWRSHYSTILRLNLNAANQLIYSSSNNWLHRHDDGSYTDFVSGLSNSTGRGDYGTPQGGAVLLANSFVSYGRSGADSILVDSRFDGASQQSRYYGSDWSGIATNGTDTVYLARITLGDIHKWTNGSFSTLISGGYTTADRIFDLTYYNGKLYQPIREKHEIREVDANTGAPRVLKVGLVSPEL